MCSLLSVTEQLESNAKRQKVLRLCKVCGLPFFSSMFYMIDYVVFLTMQNVEGPLSVTLIWFLI